MTFQEAIRVCFAKYTDFTGRASRPEFWWFALFMLLASAVASMFGRALEAVFSIVTLLPCLAVGARRLHDSGRSGWWQLIAFVPVVGWIVLLFLFAQESKGEAG